MRMPARDKLNAYSFSRSDPSRRVFHDTQRLGLFENWIRLVARTEVEHAALADLPHAAAAEVLADRKSVV